MEYSSERPTDMSQERLIQELEETGAELQVEEQKNKLLHEELDKINALHQEISQRYETVNTVRQQAETLQHELQKEVQQRKLL